MLALVADTLPFSEVKARLSEMADRVENQHDRILVTRNGRPSFILMSPDDLESLEETLDIMSDPELVESLRISRQEAAEGKHLRSSRPVLRPPRCTRRRITPEAHASTGSAGFQTRCDTPQWQTIFGPIAENPHRAGKSLMGELEGLRSARRGDYRIIYEILKEQAVVAIHRIQHRRDVYRPS